MRLRPRCPPPPGTSVGAHTPPPDCRRCGYPDLIIPQQHRSYTNMTINPTFLAQRTRSSVNWTDAKQRVIRSYRDWLRAAPEIQKMYTLGFPVSTIRTKIRQEFERHRYVQQLKTVDVLIFHSHSELQETLNFWKQHPHVLKYFTTEEEEPRHKLPNNFISGFLEGRN
ncbi:hypothetical protein IWX47DRAFT_873833 [Phyllosticta citricarpa]